MNVFLLLALLTHSLTIFLFALIYEEKKPFILLPQREKIAGAERVNSQNQQF